MGDQVTCASCGGANKERARYCDNCGAKLSHTVARPPGGNRTVTILDVDLVGSTKLGDQLSPEGFPAVIAAFYEVVDEVIAGYGGTVESHTGDGVLAVFGKPEPGVDDALRAVRAALAVRAAMPDLSHRVADYGVDVRVHSAVNTGEVSLPELLGGKTLGDPANVCSKLNGRARDGQILIGEATWHLVRDEVMASAGDPLSLHLEGKDARVKAWRVRALEPDDARSPSEAAMFGRERDLSKLRLYFDQVVEDRSCMLVTILGPAGIGKSRLVDEFLRGVAGEGCFVLQGRCLPYGDAITSRPIEQMLRTIAGIGLADELPEIERKLLEVISDPEQPQDLEQPAMSDRVTGMVARMLHGPSELGGEPSDRLYALQRLFERMAELRPLVMVVDGLHDAQAPLVEFIERLAGALRDVPVLVLCMARSEFFERPSVAGMKAVDAASMLLKPLDQHEAELVILEMLEPEPPRAVVEAITAAAGGNPMHLRHLVSMLVEQGRLVLENREWRAVDDLSELRTPPKIDAVLGTRLGRLSEAEKLVIERAAVVGERFSEADIVALLTPELTGAEVHEAIRELVSRELVGRDPAAPLIVDDRVDGFQFRHMLIQDSAYRRLDGETRSELHARYARWLQEHARQRPPPQVHDQGGSAKLAEQIGYHFASAYQELLAVRKREDAGTQELARQAGEHLARAGHLHAAQAALLRIGEKPLRRALALLPDGHPDRLIAWLDLADVLRDHDPAAAEQEYELVIEAAREIGNKQVEQHALLGQIEAQWVQHPLESPEALREQLDDAIREFQLHEDHVGLANAYRLRANVDYSRGLSKGALQDVRHALTLVEGRDDRLAAKIAQLYCIILFWGPTPLVEVKAEVEGRLHWARDRELQGLDAFMLTLLARIAVLQGDVVEAERLLAESRSVVPLGKRRIGRVRRDIPVVELLTRAAVPVSEAIVEIGAGNLPAAKDVLRRHYEALEREGKNVPRANLAALLARVVLLDTAQDEATRRAEAHHYVEECRRLALKHQLDAQIKWRSLRSLVLALEGRLDDAERLAAEAVRLSHGSEQPDTQAEALIDQAEVLRLAGKPAEGALATRAAIVLYQGKGSTAAAARAQAQLARLESA